MPLIASAKKALRQDIGRRAHNARHKNAIKKIAKDFRALIKNRDKNEAQKLLPLLYKTLDKAAKENVIKKNTAARHKSHLAKAIQRLTK